MSCSCSFHNNTKKSLVNKIRKIDPTRTSQIRIKFIAEFNRLFLSLIKDIKTTVVDLDCFGLIPSPFILEPVEVKKAFVFERTEDKVKGFMGWLKQQEKKGILRTIKRPGTIEGIESSWTDLYIESAYQKGISRAREEMRKQGIPIPSFEGPVSDQQQISLAFNQPIHADRVGVLYTRTFTDLKGITESMDTAISRTLSQGLIDGLNPRVIAKQIADNVEGIGLNRAKTLARTEVIRAHHVANIAEYERANVGAIKIQAEWLTAGDDRVCPKCASLNGKIFTLKEAGPLIPKHPNCRCIAIPYLGKEFN